MKRASITIKYGSFISNLNQLRNVDLTDALREAGTEVVMKAREKCPKGTGSSDRGHLANSIGIQYTTRKKCVIGTSVFYAPYVEFGTGAFAGIGSKYGGMMKGRGRRGWWCYVEGMPQSNREPLKTYTYDDVCRIKAWLINDQHIDPKRVHITNGHYPKPFLMPALFDNAPKIRKIFADNVRRQLNGR